MASFKFFNEPIVLYAVLIIFFVFNLDIVFDEDALDWRIEQKDVEYEFDYPDTVSSDNE